jgi:hypothetical protein
MEERHPDFYSVMFKQRLLSKKKAKEINSSPSQLYTSDLGFQISERVDYPCTLQPEIPNPKSEMYLSQLFFS